MIIGFTGTRKGITVSQFDKIVKLIQENQPSEIHHGDCIGADASIHDIAESLNIPVVIHPPSSPVLRAFKKSDTILEPKDYILRNRDIVDACDILLACPHSRIETIRSGTWSTIRYASKQNKRVHIIFPE